ncbi:CMRF35-like molecule 7 [Erinaceus europaeus]|uniref:CMRF35-like molecule 7 n=1 Tax=Erinaceus europaeus TaxID=9365 RepID=A0ABM3YBE6_ERIEU|nr:CMRF35-like molecule 7 [Erinaceus europaeus]
MGNRSLWLLPALLFSVPGTLSLTGPEAVRGWERGSVTVTCSYDSGWKTYSKYWCRGADWNLCRILVQTSRSEQEVKKDRVSIRDNHRAKTFTVTMKELRLNDADTYWCGIERFGRDPGHEVQVTIDPGVSINPSIPEESRGPSNITSHRFRSSSPLLILIFLKAPLFLIMLSVVLWVKMFLRGPGRMQILPEQGNTPVQCISHTVTCPVPQTLRQEGILRPQTLRQGA